MASLQAGIDSSEQAYWLASLRLDPLEEDRADVRHAMLSANLLTALTGKPQKPDAYLEELPWRAKPVEVAAPAPSQASLRRKIDSVMVMLGGKKR